MLTAITLSLVLGQAAKPPIQLPPDKSKPTTQQQQQQGMPRMKIPNQFAPPPIEDVGTQEETVLNITKHIAARFNPAAVPVNGSWAGGQQQDIREGEISFSLTNSTFGGKPCKEFKGQSNWDYHPN